MNADQWFVVGGMLFLLLLEVALHPSVHQALSGIIGDFKTANSQPAKSA